MLLTFIRFEHIVRKFDAGFPGKGQTVPGRLTLLAYSHFWLTETVTRPPC